MTISSFGNTNKFLEPPLEESEVSKAIKNLKSNKAGGHDGLSPEHVKNGGPILIQLITWILNCIIHTEFIPKNFCLGVCLPLYKGGDKDKLSKDNYRKITLLTILCKIFEAVTLARADEFILNSNSITHLQGAGLKGISCLHTAYLLRETITQYNENGSDVYVAYLDARKAFDGIWIKGLLHKLYKIGINGKLWRLLCLWYTQFNCKVRISSISSETFQVSQGVFQGGKWSLRLFEIYYALVIDKAIQSNKGCNIYGSRAVCAAYADDVAIAAPHIDTLQMIINRVVKCAHKWRLMFNPTKSVIMTFPYKSITPSPPRIQMNGIMIPVLETFSHLGAGIGNDTSIVNNMIKKGRTAFYGLLSLGSKCGGILPTIGSKLYRQCVIPSMLYGVELLSLSDSGIEQLEKEHRKFGKRLQHANNNIKPSSIHTAWLAVDSRPH